MTVGKEPRVGCGAAIVIDGRILLVRRLTAPEAGCWGLPGGKVELFETAEDAMRREVAEELGIVVGPADLLCFVDQIDRAAGTHWVAPVYRVRDFAGTPRNREPDKHEGSAWFALDALPAALTTPTRTALAALAREGDIAVPSHSPDAGRRHDTDAAGDPIHDPDRPA